MLPPLLPLEFLELSRRDPILVERYLEELSSLLGMELKSVDELKTAISFIIDRIKIRSINYRDKDYMDTIYMYKELDSRSYIKYPILSAMRGAVVRTYSNGEVRQITFPFSKFFNLGEVRRTKHLPDDKFIITEKLDGTLIVAWRDPDTGELRYNTRTLFDLNKVTKGKASYYISVSDIISNPYVIRFINSVKRHKLTSELETLVREGRTVMFELVYKKIPASVEFDVFDTPVDSEDWKPYLLAYRDLNTMKIHYVFDTPFPTPDTWEVDNINQIIEDVKRMDDKEGIVITYPNLTYDKRFPWWVYQVKVKSKTYVIRNYIMSGQVSWKNIAFLTIDGKIDDILPYLSQEQREFVEDYSNAYLELRMKWLKFVETVRRKDKRKLTNILKNNYNMGYLIPFLSELNKIDPEQVLKKIVKKYLLGKTSKEKLVNSLERYTRRIEKITRELGVNERIHLDT